MIALLLTTLLTVQAQAKTQTQPQQPPLQLTPIEQLDEFLGCTELKESFRLNDEVTIKSESCLTSHCDSFETIQRITNASDDQVEISSINSAGNIFQQTILTKEKWEEAHCNWARIHLSNMESFGFTTSIDELTESTQTTLFNGTEVELETRQINIQGENKLGLKIKHTLELCKDCGGLGQMIVREQENITGGLDRFTVENIVYPEIIKNSH